MVGKVAKHYEMQWRIQDFPEVGAPTLGGGEPTYNFGKFSQKLHEIEIIWILEGARMRPLRSANKMYNKMRTEP